MLTERNEAILLALTQKVRFLSLPQLARTWWSEAALGEDVARKGLRRLLEAGYLLSRDILAHPEIPLTAPAFVWKPGDPEPNYQVLAYPLQRRWTLPPRVQRVYLASPKAAHLFGGFGGRLVRLEQASHDLHVSALFCHLYLTSPEDAHAWLPEEELLHIPGERSPDAVLFDAEGIPYRALEFGGNAKPARLEKLHRFGETYSLPYELW